MSTTAQAPNYVGPGAGNPQGPSGPPPTDPFQLEQWAKQKQQSTPGAYQAAAGAQSDASHVGLNGPVGSSSWSQDPTTGQWTQSQQFSGPLAGAAQGYESQIAGQGALDLSGLSPLDMGQGARDQAQNAAYSQATSRLDPQFAQQGEQLQSQLAAQGLDPGTEAANNAQGNFARAKNDAYSSAQNYAVGQGLAAQQQAFGQSMQGRQQQLAEILQQRGMPLQQLQGLMGLMGGAQGVGAAQGPNYLGAMQAQGDFNLGQADQQNQFWGAGLNAAGNAAGAAVRLSDIRAKQKVERLLVEILPGVPAAIFEYRHAPGKKVLGVIAQDLQKVRPDLVRERRDGLLEVICG